MLRACVALIVAAVTAVPAIAAADVHRYSHVNQATIGHNSYDDGYLRLVIEGIAEGTDTVQTVAYSTYYRATAEGPGLTTVKECHRLATLALSKPGKYTLIVEFNRWSGETGGNILKCGLRLR
jgi:hypothetical protein